MPEESLLAPCSEFPILYGLLTGAAGGGREERKKGIHHAASFPFLSPASNYTYPPRPPPPSTYNTNNSTSVEPDSSTPDPHPPPTNQRTLTYLSSISSSPLLILRLTAAPTNSRTEAGAAGRNSDIDIMGGRYPSRQRKVTVPSEVDDQTPSSTTEDDDEAPHKRSRKTQDSSDEPQMPILEPMVSTSTSSSAHYSPPQNREKSLSMSPPLLVRVQSVDVHRPPPESPLKTILSGERLQARSQSQSDEAGTKTSSFHSCRRNTKKLSLPLPVPPRRQTSAGSKRRSSVLSGPSGPPDRRRRDLRTEGLSLSYQEPSSLVLNEAKSLPNLPVDIEVKKSEVRPRPRPRQRPRQVPRKPEPTVTVEGQHTIRSRPVISVKPSRPVHRLSAEDDVQVFPCGHCHQVFDSITRLVQHAAAWHLRKSERMTVDVEIETEWGP